MQDRPRGMPGAPGSALPPSVGGPGGPSGYWSGSIGPRGCPGTECLIIGIW